MAGRNRSNNDNQKSRPDRNMNKARSGSGRVRSVDLPVSTRSHSIYQSAIWIVVGAVVLVVIALVVFKVSNSSSSSTSPTSSGETTPPPGVVHEATHVPTSVLTQVGLGTSSDPITPPMKIKKKVPILMKDGKPRIVYMGAEYCPFCATERWAMVVALSRFGHFSNLGATHSSPTDVYPNTNSFDFYHSSYKSHYITFTPVELQTINYKPLQSPTALENKLISTYDVPPYVSNSSQDGSIPFIDFANQYLVIGASYSPKVLAGLSMSDIAAALSLPQSDVAQGADATANYITATICLLTHNHPASACSIKPVRKAESQIAK